MKVYIVTDMEGISGVNREEMVNQGAGEWYAQGRRLMMADINAAIRGAFDGGATEVLVCDGHGGAPHLILEDMDERAEAFLDHTQSSLAWYNYFVNGRKFGEIGQEAMVGGHFGVPLILATGDHAACAEAHDLLGDDIATVEVKSAIGRQWARCLHPRVAQEAIQSGAAQAMKLVGKAKPFKIDLPATVRLELYRTDMADGYAGSHRVRRVGPREIEFTAETQAEILSFS